MHFPHPVKPFDQRGEKNRENDKPEFAEALAVVRRGGCQPPLRWYPNSSLISNVRKNEKYLLTHNTV